ncbi:MAG: hypothetical protein MZV70_53455 [Desulfobacterales bacterium]|nr:hypothetical protein [Desulfobacterales bacterium]
MPGEPSPGELVCGLLRDSLDGAGRPFPFLIVGTGRLEGWEKHWVYLPEIVGGLWERLELLSTKRVFDLEELKADVGRLPSPVFNKGMAACWKCLKAMGLCLMPRRGCLSLELKGTGDHSSEIMQGLKTLRARSLSVPDAVFIGGLLEQPLSGGIHKAAATRRILTGLWTMGAT